LIQTIGNVECVGSAQSISYVEIDHNVEPIEDIKIQLNEQLDEELDYNVEFVEDVHVDHISHEMDYNYEPVEDVQVCSENEHVQSIESLSNQNTQKWKKKCCFYGCMNTNLDSSMFSFPNVIQFI